MFPCLYTEHLAHVGEDPGLCHPASQFLNLTSCHSKFQFLATIEIHYFLLSVLRAVTTFRELLAACPDLKLINYWLKTQAVAE